MLCQRVLLIVASRVFEDEYMSVWDVRTEWLRARMHLSIGRLGVRLAVAIETALIGESKCGYPPSAVEPAVGCVALLVKQRETEHGS